MESHSIQTINSSGSQNQIEMIKKIEKYNINLTKMTLIFSFVSTVCHTIVFASSSVLLFYKNQSYLLLGTVFIVLLKNSSNILLFYFFNKNFKKKLISVNINYINKLSQSNELH